MTWRRTFGMRVIGAAALALLTLLTVVAAPAPAAHADVGLFEDGWAVVAHDNGDGLRVRPKPDVHHGMYGVAPSGALLKLLDGPIIDADGLIWFHVTYQDWNGYSQVYFMAPSDRHGNRLGYGIVYNTDGDPIRVRSEPNKNGDVLTHVYEGHVYPIVGGLIKDSTGQGWYEINKDGQLYGWVMADYLYPHAAPGASSPPVPSAPAAPAPAPRQPAPAPVSHPSAPAPAAPAPAPAPANPAPSSRGGAIVAFARKYLGYAYVWGGTSPKAGGFDCSGFVYWVLTQNGISTGRNMEDEAAVGSAVSRGNLQPGDLVFFANTYKAGLSHAGIYIGGGQFIHAENESTGVTISDMGASYWASRYYSARRP